MYPLPNQIPNKSNDYAIDIQGEVGTSGLSNKEKEKTKIANIVTLKPPAKHEEGLRKKHYGPAWYAAAATPKGNVGGGMGFSAKRNLKRGMLCQNPRPRKLNSIATTTFCCLL